jgi:tetratricopeptide (TPR) repeat protein
MSYLIELLGNGLLGDLRAAFTAQLPDCPDDELEQLRAQRIASPTSLDVAMRHAMAALRENEYGEARRAFRDALTLSASPVQPALGLACVYDELGKPDECMRYLLFAHEYDPSDPAVTFAIAFCRERSGDTDGAVECYRRALAACPRLRNAFERLAAIAIRRRDLAEALRCYECLAEIEPDDVDVLMMLATLYLQANRPLDAIVQFERGLLIEPECTDSALSQTEALESEGMLEEAVSKMRSFIRKYPGIADFHVHLGDLLVRSGDDDGAIEQYKAALELHPRYLEATIKLGTQHLRKARFEDAARSFNKAVELNDRLITAYVGLGVAQHAEGRRHEASATFDLASSLEPNSTLLFAETARLALKVEHREQAAHEPARRKPPPRNDDAADLLGEQLRRHRQALALCPNHADLHYRYGLLLRQVGDFDAAVRSFRRALCVNPIYVKALVRLGLCLKEMGQAEEGLDIFRRALGLNDENIDTHYDLGLLFAQRNQFDLAVERYEHTSAIGADASFRDNVALALQNIGMIDRAAATWRSIRELGAQLDETSEQRAALLPDSGEFDPGSP